MINVINVNDDRLRLANALKIARARIERAEFQLNDRDVALGHVNGQLAIANGQRANAQNQLGAANLEVARLNGTVGARTARLNGQVERLNGRVGRLNGQVAGLNGQVARLNGQLGIANGQRVNAQNQLGQAYVQVAELNGQLAATRTMRAEYNTFASVVRPVVALAGSAAFAYAAYTNPTMVAEGVNLCLRQVSTMTAGDLNAMVGQYGMVIAETVAGLAGYAVSSSVIPPVAYAALKLVNTLVNTITGLITGTSGAAVRGIVYVLATVVNVLRACVAFVYRHRTLALATVLFVVIANYNPTVNGMVAPYVAKFVAAATEALIMLQQQFSLRSTDLIDLAKDGLAKTQLNVPLYMADLRDMILDVFAALQSIFAYCYAGINYENAAYIFAGLQSILAYCYAGINDFAQTTASTQLGA